MDETNINNMFKKSPVQEINELIMMLLNDVKKYKNELSIQKKKYEKILKSYNNLMIEHYGEDIFNDN